MQKMYAQASDLSAVLRKAIQLRLAAPPVVAGPPILYECLKLGQRDPLTSPRRSRGREDVLVAVEVSDRRVRLVMRGK